MSVVKMNVRGLKMTEAQEILREALAIAENIALMPELKVDARPGRERTASLAEGTRQLLFLAHVCDKAKVAVMDQYHSSRGFPLPITPTSEMAAEGAGRMRPVSAVPQKDRNDK